MDDTFRIFEQNIRRDVHNCVTRKIVRGKNVIRSKVINVVANDRSIVATFSSFVAVIMIKNNEYRRIFSRVWWKIIKRIFWRVWWKIIKRSVINAPDDLWIFLFVLRSLIIIGIVARIYNFKRDRDTIINLFVTFSIFEIFVKCVTDYISIKANHLFYKKLNTNIHFIYFDWKILFLFFQKFDRFIFWIIVRFYVYIYII